MRPDDPLRRAAPVLLLALLVTAVGCGGSDAEAEAGRPGGPGGGTPASAVPIAAQTAAPGELRVTLRGTANLQARNRVEVLSKQGGVVSRVFAEEGVRVAAGAPLAALDAEEWQLQARQADARATAAQGAAERALELQRQELIAD